MAAMFAIATPAKCIVHGPRPHHLVDLIEFFPTMYPRSVGDNVEASTNSISINF